MHVKRVKGEEHGTFRWKISIIELCQKLQPALFISTTIRAKGERTASLENKFVERFGLVI